MSESAGNRREAPPPAPAANAALERGQPNVIVRFRVPGDSQRYRSEGLSLGRGDRVVVETDKGAEVGTVTRGSLEGRANKRVLRQANPDDLQAQHDTRKREQEAAALCREQIRAHALPMKLVSTEFAQGGSQALFFFTSAERVDFRALVKELARRLHMRIEMRQIGVRDGTRHLGGVGICGQQLCCSKWLPAFKPISIRMAKDQNLSLNQQKLSGVCGRLRCCLEYEQSTYQEKRKGLPKLGKRVMTPHGEGRVKDIDVLRARLRIELVAGGYVECEASECERLDANSGRTETRTSERAPAAPAASKRHEADPAGDEFDSEEADDENELDAADAQESDTGADVDNPSEAQKNQRRRRRRRRPRRPGGGREGGGNAGPSGAPQS